MKMCHYRVTVIHMYYEKKVNVVIFNYSLVGPRKNFLILLFIQHLEE